MLESIIWVLIIIAAVVIEMNTAALVSIWFAGGAVVALIFELCGAKLYIQILVFLIISAICVCLLRHTALKSLIKGDNKTNMDRIIGQTLIITQEVNNINGTGTARVNDIDWKVVSLTGEIISEGELVTVTKIEGVKLFVKKMEE